MQKVLSLFIVLYVFTSAFTQAQNTIYVATDGDDSNLGDIDNPFRTFNKAVSEMSAGDTCIIREGIYEEELIIEKSGTSGNYLIFKAADGEDVEIRATTIINGWQLHNGNIYKATVDMQVKDGDDGRFRAVYHNKEYMDLARWPNNVDNNRWTIDCQPVDDGDGSYFQVSDLPNIDWTGGLVYYLGAHSGASWTRRITNSTANRIEHAGVDITKWPFTPHNPTVWRNYTNNERGQLFLFNKLEALDHAREWFYDNAAKVLYLQTANGSMPIDGSVEYATRKFTAQIRGDYIKIEGVNFFGGSVKIHRDAIFNEILNCKIIHGSEGHDSLNNGGAQVGEAALEILGGNTTVKGCTIDHSSVNGITVQNWSGAHNSVIEGNYITNTDYVGIHASPIRSSARNVKILKNTIFNTGRDGMYVAGTDCEIAYNDVSESQKINSDSGIFYTVGNADLKNNEIHHNWFHDATAQAYSHETNNPGKAAGIYLDNNSKGFTVHHNVVWNVSWSGYQVNWNNTHLDFYHNTIWNAERAMDAWVNGFTQENNKVYNSFANTGSWFSETATDFDIQDSPIFSESPFEDPDNNNFMPKSASTLIDQGQVISGFEKPFKGGGPDIGAYERGGTRWTAGVNAIEDTGEGTEWSIYDTQFRVKSNAESCPDADNGRITITADFAEDYVLSFDGNETDFTTERIIENLVPGQYSLCVSLKDSPDEEQCFGIEIVEAEGLTAKTVLKQNTVAVNINQGTPPFSVFVNDEMVYKTFDFSFSLQVAQGDTLEIKSDKDCEGKLIESIDFNKSILAHPNPTSGNFSLNVPIDEGSVLVEIYNIQSQIISSKVYNINVGEVQLTLENNKSGIYFAKIGTKQPKMIKVVKK